MENKPQKKNRILINFNAKNWGESAKKLKETYDELLASVRDKCKAECKEHEAPPRRDTQENSTRCFDQVQMPLRE